MSGNSPDALERAACIPKLVERGNFNDLAVIPYGCAIEHIYEAMQAFAHFLQVVNLELNTNGMSRLESLLMPANFSSIVSEFMNSSIPRFCPTLAKNGYHKRTS